jgi:predicted ATPase
LNKSIVFDENQHRVVSDLDKLWNALPAYQDEMQDYGKELKKWLRDWEEVKDAVIEERLQDAVKRKDEASPLQGLINRQLAKPIAELSENNQLFWARLPDSVAQPLSRWAETRIAEETDVLIVYEDEIDARVGRACPEPPKCPQGMYMYGSVGTGKSLCMDLFFSSSENRIEHRRRVHFNSFMMEVQARLHRYGQAEGAKEREGTLHKVVRPNSHAAKVLRAEALQKEGAGKADGKKGGCGKESCGSGGCGEHRNESVDMATRPQGGRTQEGRPKGQDLPMDAQSMVVHSSANEVASEEASGVTITNANLQHYDEDEEDARGTLLDKAPLVVNGVTIVGRTGDARPSPMVQGRSIHDPFSAVARELLGSVADRGGLLCFDELQVRAHAGDAMYIAELMIRRAHGPIRNPHQWISTLFMTHVFISLLQVNDPFNAVAIKEIFMRLLELGVVIVTTSNRELDSLNRWTSISRDATFAPLVDAMAARCQQTNLDGNIDYRRAEDARMETAESGFLVGEGEKIRESLDGILTSLREEGAEEYFKDGQVSVLFGRMLTVPEGCWRGPGGNPRGVARFSFETLCGSALGSSDYAGIAAHFSVVMLDDIPKMNFNTRAQARRFITLVDELYNRRVRLVCSAAAEIDNLFDGVAGLDLSHDMEQMAFETEAAENKSRFDLTTTASVAATNRSIQDFSGEDERFAFSRAASRLHEMQTPQYYALQYVPATECGGINNGNGSDGIDPKLKLAVPGAQQVRSARASE